MKRVCAKKCICPLIFYRDREKSQGEIQMSSVADSLNQIAEAIRNINPYATDIVALSDFYDSMNSVMYNKNIL